MPSNTQALLTGENTSYANNIPTRKTRFPWDFKGTTAQLLLESFSAAQILRDQSRFVGMFNAFK
jgi:hypothetical protein